MLWLHRSGLRSGLLRAGLAEQHGLAAGEVATVTEARSWDDTFKLRRERDGQQLDGWFSKADGNRKAQRLSWSQRYLSLTTANVSAWGCGSSHF